MGEETRDQGFTLIELLVVVIIIAILMAIAIPVFLNQRSAGYDAAAKSDLRNLAAFEEGYFEFHNTYATIHDIDVAGDPVAVSKSVTLSVVNYLSGSYYCLSARHSGSVTTWWYDSSGGGLQPKGATGCPVATGGVAGDTITGS